MGSAAGNAEGPWGLGHRAGMAGGGAWGEEAGANCYKDSSRWAVAGAGSGCVLSRGTEFPVLQGWAKGRHASQHLGGSCMPLSYLSDLVPNAR